MTSNIPIIKIVGRLRNETRAKWQPPFEFGPDGWSVDENPAPDYGRRIIVTLGPLPLADDLDDESQWWLHASISRRDRIPSYDDLVALHKSIWPDGWSYQVFAPPRAHVNIHAHALHLWGRLDGRAELPNFGAHGTI